jgi:hypothetical protein
LLDSALMYTLKCEYLGNDQVQGKVFLF